MEFYYDQALKPEEILDRRDKVKALANEWYGKLITAVAGANGAGLIALATHLSSRYLNFWVAMGIFTSAACFTAGLAFIAYSLLATHYIYEMQSESLNQQADAHFVRKHFTDKITDEELLSTTSQKEQVAANLSGIVLDAYNKRQKSVKRSIRLFIAGLIIGLSSIAANAIRLANQPTQNCSQPHTP